MNVFGINLLDNIRQITICATVPLIIVAYIFFVRTKLFPKFFTGLVGLLTAWITIFPIALFIGFIVVIALNIINMPQDIGDPFSFYDSIAPLGDATTILVFLLMAFYIAHAKNSSLISNNDRKYYQIGFVLFPVVVMPMYYLKFMKNKTAVNETA